MSGPGFGDLALAVSQNGREPSDLWDDDVTFTCKTDVSLFCYPRISKNGGHSFPSYVTFFLSELLTHVTERFTRALPV